MLLSRLEGLIGTFASQPSDLTLLSTHTKDNLWGEGVSKRSTNATALTTVYGRAHESARLCVKVLPLHQLE